ERVEEEAMEEEELIEGGTEGINLIPPDLSRYEYRTAYGTGETRKVNSWIWEYGHGRNKLNVDDGADDDNEILRAEWCKSRARMHRATEEVKLLLEEMKRTLKYLEWAAIWWDGFAGTEDKSVSGGLREGRRAYALKQARIQRSLHNSFETLWRVPLNNWDEREAVKEEEEDILRLEGGDDPDEEQDEDEEEYVDE
ncbi:hypothetical protein V5O48_018545, partial [Marasmius crinis-equi]